MKKKKIVVGISGASGAPLSIALLKELQKHEEIEIHLVISGGGELTITQETAYSVDEVKKMADVCYDQHEIGAAIASGSFSCEGMIIVPCSMKTVAGIASGYTDNLLTRAADVMIKEQRTLVLVAREAPMSQIHLRNLSFLAGIPKVVIMPPVMTFYHLPKSIEEMMNHTVGKILDQFGMECTGYRRWNG